jgi:hypothetical protein
MVLVAMPAPPPDFRSGMGIGPGGPMAIDAVKKHVESGQPAMVFLAPSNLTGIPQPDAMLDVLKPYGINVQSARLIVSPTPMPNGRVVNTPNMRLTDWIEGHPVSTAVRGLMAVSVQALPIDLPESPPEGVKVWPLLKTPQEVFATTRIQEARDAKREDNDPAGPLTIAAAAEKGGGRLAVLSDQYFAADGLVTAGPRHPLTNEIMFTQFPGNGELFVNTVAWLSGLDTLIAPGARTLDARRIGRVPYASQVTIWITLLVALPLACLGAGVGVWLVRRR